MATSPTAPNDPLIQSNPSLHQVPPTIKKPSIWDNIIGILTFKQPDVTGTPQIQRVVTNKTPPSDSPSSPSNSIARKKILKILGKESDFPSATILEKGEFEALKKDLMRDNCPIDILANLKVYINQRNKEISDEGRSFSHFFAKFFNRSITGQAEQLYNDVCQQLEKNKDQEKLNTLNSLVNNYHDNIELPEGKYEGMLNEKNQPIGYGTFIDKNEAIFTGYFSEGKAFGEKKHLDGTLDKGEFSSIATNLKRGIRSKDDFILQGFFNEDDSSLNALYSGIKTEKNFKEIGEFRKGELVEGTRMDGINRWEGKFEESQLIWGTHQLEKTNYKQEGTFVNGKLEGYGKRSERNISDGQHPYDLGLFYEGHFQNDEPHGLGKIVDKNGLVIEEGRWKDGLFVRQEASDEIIVQPLPLQVSTLFPKTATVVTIEGLGRYSGAVNTEGLPHGNGSLIRTNGSKCYGKFENGNFVEGKFTRTDGSYLKGKFWGDFENGLLKKGTITINGIATELGFFDNQLRLDGQGIRYQGDNKQLKGQFKFGEPHGYVRTEVSTLKGPKLFEGIYTLGKLTGNMRSTSTTHEQTDIPSQDGLQWDFSTFKTLKEDLPLGPHMYAGPTDEAGQPHGEGVLFRNDGSRCQGKFENGNFVEGKFTKYKENESGKIVRLFMEGFFDGNFEDGLLVKGQIIHKDGTEEIGNFNELQLNGKGYRINSEDDIIAGEYKDGEYNGHMRITVQKNPHVIEVDCKNGIPERLATIYANGTSTQKENVAELYPFIFPKVQTVGVRKIDVDHKDSDNLNSATPHVDSINKKGENFAVTPNTVEDETINVDFNNLNIVSIAEKIEIYFDAFGKLRQNVTLQEAIPFLQSTANTFLAMNRNLEEVNLEISDQMYLMNAANIFKQVITNYPSLNVNITTDDINALGKYVKI